MKDLREGLGSRPDGAESFCPIDLSLWLWLVAIPNIVQSISQIGASLGDAAVVNQEELLHKFTDGSRAGSCLALVLAHMPEIWIHTLRNHETPPPQGARLHSLVEIEVWSSLLEVFETVTAPPIARLPLKESPDSAQVPFVPQEVCFAFALGPELDRVRERGDGLAMPPDEGASEIDMLDTVLLGMQIRDLTNVVAAWHYIRIMTETQGGKKYLTA